MKDPVKESGTMGHHRVLPEPIAGARSGRDDPMEREEPPPSLPRREEDPPDLLARAFQEIPPEAEARSAPETSVAAERSAPPPARMPGEAVPPSQDSSAGTTKSPPRFC
ncbi:hypothetical protein [Verrucomicrobium sp. 3C]|uniref:hypothetical protein n=1 Tax=Verrucomicrobium sp. 3C TaxID=1134055 RepID=UPI00037D01C7|nr:hypothetical protein [Verrucomicrobium sp. 3C]